MQGFSLLVAFFAFSPLVLIDGLEFSTSDEWSNPASYCENGNITDVLTKILAINGNGDIEYTLVKDASIPLKLCNATGSDNRSPDGFICYDGEVFDREVQSTYLVKQVAYDSATSVPRTTRIIVLDVNDNTPQFQNLPYTLDILETDETGQVLLPISAVDFDNGLAGRVDFTLINNDEGICSLESIPYAGGVFGANLLLDKELNYEISQIHILTVMAEDGGTDQCEGTESKNSTTPIYLNVKDGPDTPPIFSQPQYSASVKEQSPKGTFIVTVDARDGDYGLNWPVLYSLPEGSEMFQINNTSGEITVKTVVDRESEAVINNNGFYELIVEATEQKEGDGNYTGFPGPQSNRVVVDISIEDVNDEAPTFYNSAEYVTTVTDYTVTIPENSQNPISGIVFLKDADDGDNSEFSVTVNNTDFDVDPSTVTSQASVSIVIENPESLDYETVKQIQLSIFASDGTYNNTATLTIILEDTNDNFPVFNEDNYEFEVFENAPIGEAIGTIKATDADSGDYGSVTFSLAPVGTFNIYENGTVYVNDALDREQIPEYYVTVRVVDGDGFFNTTQLKIVVTDVNDNSPRFQQSEYSGNWIEEAVASDPILIRATDLDEPGNPNSEITYEFADNSLNQNYTITPMSDSTAVEILPKAPLNAEGISNGECLNGAVRIELEVLAKDGGDEPLWDNATILIFLQDVNEFSPVFEKMDYAASIPEESEQDTVIVNVTASDQDVCDPNNVITYSVGADFATLFSIQPDTGTLQVRSETIDRDDKEVYNVIVEAVDNGQPRQTGTTTVLVTITDINNKDPEFNSNNNVANVTENAEVGITVATLEASDPDQDSELEFNITGTECFQGSKVGTGCQTWFAISTNGNEGVIRVNSELDRETFDQVVLTVQVQDVNGTNQFATTTIQIIIDDYNDNAPELNLEPDEYGCYFYVDEGKSGFVSRVTATDDDIGVNAQVNFAMNNPYVTMLSDGSMEVQNGSNIDREGVPGDDFTAVIHATDKGEPSLTTNMTVTFCVNDINDNDPSFGEESFTCSIQENLENGASVCTITATDLDIGSNGEITYSLSPADDFNVESTTGTIVTRTSFDRETKSQYSLKLTAKDNAGAQSRSSVADVTISITDVDDNDPEFQSATQEMSVDENQPIGTNVGKVEEATDRDTKNYSINSYFLLYEETNQERSFLLDKDSRIITTNTVLDREKNTSYVLHVLATRNSTISSTLYEDYTDDEHIIEVTVDIDDENDNSPEFDREAYTADIQITAQISENNVITTVKATDKDEGVNAALVYNITSQMYNAAGAAPTAREIFTIRTIQGKGYIYLIGALSANVGDTFVLTLLVEDGGTPKLSDEATLTITVFASDETVILESELSVVELNDHRDDLEEDLEEALNADVIIDSIVEHGVGQTSRAATESTSQNSDIYFHATEYNSTNLMPADDIINELDNTANSAVLAQWEIISISTDNPITQENVTENDILKAVLVIVSCLLIVILVVYTIAFVCMRKSYRRKMNAARATEDAARDMMKMNGKEADNRNVPNTNKHASGEQELYVAAMNGNINIERIWDTNDDDSIDDNAVDSQDSGLAIDHNTPEELYMDMDQNFDEVDIDYDDSSDAQKLAAALSNRKNGAEDIVLMFDNPAMEQTPM